MVYCAPYGISVQTLDEKTLTKLLAIAKSTVVDTSDTSAAGSSLLVNHHGRPADTSVSSWLNQHSLSLILLFPVIVRYCSIDQDYLVGEVRSPDFVDDDVLLLLVIPQH